MSDTVVRRGYDTWANSGAPTTEYGSGNYIQLRSTTRRGFAYLPLSGIRGRTVLSATLEMHVRGTWAAQTLSVRRIAADWAAATLNWNNQPGVTGVTATKVTGALADGALIEVDVTTQIQQIANGSAWYGFRITTDYATTAQKLASFNSGLTAWTLTVELSDAPEQPSSLAPDGGAVSSAKPILSWDFTDLGGSSTEQASLQVQVDPAANPTTPAYDTGEIVSTEPEVNLASMPRTVTIGTTNASTTITGATGTFSTTLDVGATITGAGIPAGATITAVASSTSATISAAATATSAAVAAEITRSHPGIASGATTQWRVRVKDADNLWSAWSDWASYTYTPKPTLTISQPTVAGVIYDPTPPIEAQIATGVLESWRIRVTAGNDRTKILYDSGRRKATHATDIKLTLPQRNDDGRRILIDDTTYQLHVRAWDNVDRAPGVTADPTYVEQWRTFVFNDDATVEAPAALTVTQVGGSPKLKFNWTRSVDPDAWVITRNGKVYTRLSLAQAPKVGGVYGWTDGGFAEPYEAATWRAKAVVANRQSAPSNAVVRTPQVVGVWLITSTGLTVWMRGADPVDNFKTLDRVATYQPINVAHDVDIFYGQEGVSDSFAGTIRDEPDQSVDAALDVLQAIKDAPTQPVQMIWASKSVPVKLRHLTFLPSKDYLPTNHKHMVSFEFNQVGDFDVEDL